MITVSFSAFYPRVGVLLSEQKQTNVICKDSTSIRGKEIKQETAEYQAQKVSAGL